MNNFFNGPFEKQVVDFITNMPVNVQKPYPQLNITTKNEKLANLLLSAFADGGNAEMSAVAQYINHSQTISNKSVSNLLLYVALIEMYHLQLIARMITDLGGNLRYWNSNNAYWSGGNIDYGDTVTNKLSLDIYSEEEAISGYQAILREINTLNVPELAQVSSMINRIIEDEYLHISLFKEAYQENGGK